MSQSKELDCLNNVASNMHLLVYVHIFVQIDTIYIFVYIPGINIAYSK